MGELLPMPAVGDVFLDVRGDDRTMRVSYHQERGVVVVSLWAGVVCRGSFRLSAGDVGRLVEVLSGVVDPAADEVTEPQPALAPEQTGDVSRSVLVPRVA